MHIERNIKISNDKNQAKKGEKTPYQDSKNVVKFA